MTTENGNKGSGQSLEAASQDVVDAPLSDVRLTTSVSSAELRAFIARAETQARIREIVVARVGKEAPGDLIKDLVQSAIEAALQAKSPPRSMETARGWVGTVTARAVVDHFRRDAVHIRWLRRDVEVEELPSEPDEPGEGVAPPWLLTGWLRPRVAGNPRDQETYELLLYKATTGKTHAEVAANHAIPRAPSNRASTRSRRSTSRNGAAASGC